MLDFIYHMTSKLLKHRKYTEYQADMPGNAAAATFKTFYYRDHT